jgi:hypothetical protein
LVAHRAGFGEKLVGFGFVFGDAVEAAFVHFAGIAAAAGEALGAGFFEEHHSARWVFFYAA